MMKSRRISYVVLHYLAEKETEECVESILKANSHSKIETEVVIVDNGSSNDSGEKLAEYFRKEKNVTVLFNEENLGFANGINRGFMYSTRVLKADFVVAVNNDVTIAQDNFNEVILDKYDEYKYAVLGPDIVTLDNKHQNPMNEVKWTKLRLMKFRLKKHIELFLTKFSIFDKYLKINNGAFHKDKINRDVLNTQLHGACLIFSPIYIEKFNGLYSGTFLYMEEDILKLRADYAKILMMYTADLVVYHKEDVATNMAMHRSLARKRVIYKNLLNSSGEYLKIFNSQKNGGCVKKTFEKIAKKYKGADYSIDERIPLRYLIGFLMQRIRMTVRGLFRLRKKVFLGKNVTLKDKKNIRFGKSVTIADGCYLDGLSTDGLVLSDGSSLGRGTIVRCSGNMQNIGKGFHLGRCSSLADNCFVGATGGVFIGNNTICGQDVRFHASNHLFDDLSKPIRKQGVECKGIYIGNNCWIGAGAVFLDGVSVGDGCVIGANAVVTKDIPNDFVVVGSPAKVIRKRGEK